MGSTVMPLKDARLKDIAERTGLSLTAVSRALRDKSDIGEETKRQVRSIAEELGYRPHGIARSLALGKTYALGLANTEISQPLYAELAETIAREAERAGYSLLLFLSPPIPAPLDELISLMNRKNTDGIIVLAGNAESADTSRLIRQKREPIVFFGLSPQAGVSQVTVDREAGVRNAVKTLAGLGHSSFAFLCAPHSQTKKLEGFRRGLKDLGLPLRADWLLAGRGIVESGYEATKRLLRGSELPTAVFYHNDLAALGGLHAFQEAGVRVPEDVSVVGYDDILMAAHSCPPLTTLSSPTKPIAAALVRMLLATIEDPDRAPEQIVLMPELITRGSTGAPKTRRES